MKVEELSILLVEPSPTQIKLIQRHLTEAGVGHVEGVHSGEEALASMTDYVPDLVVSAMYLPDMTAPELVAALRRNPGWAGVGFMLVSSETDIHTLEPLRQAGILAILPKPFDHEHLRRALRSTADYLDPAAAVPVAFQDLRVLVVDDSTTSRKHMARTLNALGIDHVLTAEDGMEAVDLVERHLFDLVVTDLHMPELDGQGLVEHIRRRMGNASMPILMVTSEQSQARLASVEQAGVSAICDKPFDLHHLREILCRVLDER
ncbi:response regulator [Methylomagnum ishizawai]|uniref:response regulator n=1 Tax=Methylomagnum ishizawai TaxID=1760988 RepID=UPI001C338879|nr:response regulator [Methylomagnum ishizawai]BBL76954.1 response regulator [Methylomagnum ishizawai]